MHGLHLFTAFAVNRNTPYILMIVFCRSLHLPVYATKKLSYPCVYTLHSTRAETNVAVRRMNSRRRCKCTGGTSSSPSPSIKIPPYIYSIYILHLHKCTMYTCQNEYCREQDELKTTLERHGHHLPQRLHISSESRFQAVRTIIYTYKNIYIFICMYVYSTYKRAGFDLKRIPVRV